MLLFLLALTVFGFVKMPAKNNFYSFLLNLGLVQSWGFINTISWNETSWSISTEFFAYLLFPFLILKVYRKSKTALLFSAAVAVSWIFFNPYFHMLRLFEGFGWVDLSGIQFNYGNALFWWFFVFVSGVILFCIKDTVARWINTPYFFDACTLIGLVVLFYVSCNAAAMPRRDAIATVAAILIVFGLSRDAGIGRLVFGNSVSLFLGRISYSLYLSHEWVRYTAIQFIHPLPVWLNLAMALSVATLLHFFLERPARRLLRKKWTRKTIPLSDIQADTREA
jgi:peptidoglycan/LPS O-acetylase OafA/YrhL